MAAQEATGKTVEEAARKALSLLGCTRDEATVEVLEAPSKGFFGIFGAHPAKVRVTKKEAAASQTAVPRREKATAAAPAARPKQQPAAPKSGSAEASAKHASQPMKAAERADHAESTASEPAERAESAGPSDRPWMPPDESGAIDTPYSEQRSYGVTATTPPEAKPFGDGRENHRERWSSRRDDRDNDHRDRHGRRSRRDRRSYDEDRPSRRDFHEDTVAAAPEKPATPPVPVTPDYEGVAEDDLTPRQRAEKFLCEVFRCMGLDVAMTLQETDEGSIYNLQGDGLGILIGKHGQTLDALQYLANLAANKGREDGRIHVILDAMDYRSRREETLRRLAGHLAEKACRIHAEVRLEPMNRHERKIIHMALQGSSRVSTYSDGDEPYRCVVIAPKKKRLYRPRRERNAESAERVEEE